MAKKVVKKRKLKVFNFLIVLLVLSGLFFGVYELSQVSIKNIVIKKTKYLNDDYILELAKLKDYPSFFLTSSNGVEKRLKSSKYINSAHLRKKIGFIVELEIDENRPLFYNTNNNKYVLGNEKEIKEDAISRNFRVPRLLNYVPDKKYKKFVSGMHNVKADILSKISDIEYKPNDYDKDRFLLYMDDGNVVYLTLTKFKMINHYNDVLKQLENHKGILYLDNGNHFQIKE
ncbi:MAG: FtsQ-type POTRA domain-containing protein [Bacilli bacterium]|nr:FtsQ-type POTRA domain-containing protein [Bacilli bacterium]